MDDNNDGKDQVDRLATCIGMIMEHMTVIALTVAPRDDPARAEALDDLVDAARRTGRLDDKRRSPMTMFADGGDFPESGRDLR